MPGRLALLVAALFGFSLALPIDSGASVTRSVTQSAVGVVATRSATQSVVDEAAIEAAAVRIGQGLRCPRCQGLSIEDSPDALAVQMAVVVRQQLREGRTPEEIRQYFVSRYGEWILLKPDPRGFNLVVYLAPILVGLGGALLVASRVRSWTARGAAAAEADELPPGYLPPEGG